MTSPIQKADHAIAQLTEPIDTPSQMFDAGNKHIPAITSGLTSTPAPDVATANAYWATENANLGIANQAVVKCETALAAARVTQAGAARRWIGRAKGTLNAVNVFADGSKDLIGGLGLGVSERVESELETMPVNLKGVRSVPVGVATWKWKTHKGNHGYIFQHCTNPADATTISLPAYSSTGTFELLGQTPGATLYARVAAFDARLPARQTEYTAWVAVVVSA